MPNTIALNLTRLANAKEAIAEAIEAKGVTLEENDGFEDFADAIMEISGGGTAKTKVKLLKSIKSVGNSIIPTDIVPSYDWTTVIDLLIGASVPAAEGHASYMMGSMKIVSGESVGYYGVYVDRNSYTFLFTQGNNWDTTPRLDFYETDAKNTLYMRRGSADTTFGAHNVTNATTANATNLTDAPLAFCGVTANTDGVFNHQPNASREITIYGARLYNASGTLLHNLIPAEDLTTYRGGLYDLITGKFYPTHEDYDDVIKGEGAIEIPSDYIGISCTALEYAAMLVHNSNTIYTVTDGNAIYKYLGDDPIGGSVRNAGWIWAAKDDYTSYAGTNRGFTFPVAENQTSFTQPTTGLVFDRTKAWDIVTCIKLSDPANRGSNAVGALFGGGGSWPEFSSFPSAEMQSDGGLWFGVSSDGNGYASSTSVSKSTLDSCLVVGKNFLKFSYDGTNTIRISHSSDGKTYTNIDTTTINFTPYNGQNQTTGFQFGAVGGNDFAATIDNHMVINECKLYSEGVLIYGNEFVQKNFAII